MNTLPSYLILSAIYRLRWWLIVSAPLIAGAFDGVMP